MRFACVHGSGFIIMSVIQSAAIWVGPPALASFLSQGYRLHYTRKLEPGFGEFLRIVEAEVESNSRNKINQTWDPLLWPTHVEVD